jgi:hypothetical protein
MIVNDDLERMWKEAIFVVLKKYARILLAGFRKITKILSQREGYPWLIIEP